jgi:phage terminase small subunit
VAATGQTSAADNLTPKQRRFVEEYLVDLNATQAAIRAGYSEDSAKAIGCENLTKPDIAAAVAEAAEARSKRTQIDADWVLQRLALEADADISDLFDADGKVLPAREWPAAFRRGLVAGIEVEELRGEGISGVVRKVKLGDRLKRIELIGRHIAIGAFKDRVEHTGKDGGPIETRELSPRDALRRMLFALTQAEREIPVSPPDDSGNSTSTSK